MLTGFLAYRFFDRTLQDVDKGSFGVRNSLPIWFHPTKDQASESWNRLPMPYNDSMRLPPGRLVRLGRRLRIWLSTVRSFIAQSGFEGAVLMGDSALHQTGIAGTPPSWPLILPKNESRIKSFPASERKETPYISTSRTPDKSLVSRSNYRSTEFHWSL